LALGLTSALLALPGCLDTVELGKFGLRDASKPGATASQRTPALKKLSMANGDVVVVGPRGYCIDPKARKLRPGGGFALIAACETLTGGGAGPGVTPAVLTVTILPKSLRPSQPSAAELAAALAPAHVLAKEDGDGLSVVQLATGGEQFTPTSDLRHWRAAMVINGHLVTLAVYGSKGSAVAGQKGMVLILELAEALRDASPVKVYAPEAIAKPIFKTN